MVIFLEFQCLIDGEGIWKYKYNRPTKASFLTTLRNNANGMYHRGEELIAIFKKSRLRHCHLVCCLRSNAWF